MQIHSESFTDIIMDVMMKEFNDLFFQDLTIVQKYV